MNIPKVITDLIAAQNNHDSAAYTECFSKTAVVFDEGHTHTGKAAIKNWIEKANQQYRSVLKPLNFEETGASSILTAQVSGTFDGSPAILKFHFDIANGLVQSLKVTG